MRCAVPGWLYDALSGFGSFMDRGSTTDFVLVGVIGGFGPLILVALHEIGHALAARLRGRAVHTSRVGDNALLTVPLGSMRLELGWATGKGDVLGYVRFGARYATPTDTLVIALAGPAASLISALFCAQLCLLLIPHGVLGAMFGLLALQGLLMGVVNLVPRGPSPGMWSDGYWARASWQARRAGIERWGAAPARRPEPSGSVAPPSAQPPVTPVQPH